MPALRSAARARRSGVPNFGDGQWRPSKRLGLEHDARRRPRPSSVRRKGTVAERHCLPVARLRQRYQPGRLHLARGRRPPFGGGPPRRQGRSRLMPAVHRGADLDGTSDDLAPDGRTPWPAAFPPSLIPVGARCRPVSGPTSSVGTEARDVPSVARSACGPRETTGSAESRGLRRSAHPPLVAGRVISSVGPSGSRGRNGSDSVGGQMRRSGQSQVMQVGPGRLLHATLGDPNHDPASCPPPAASRPSTRGPSVRRDGPRRPAAAP